MTIAYFRLGRNHKLELKFVAVRIHKDDMAVVIWGILFYFTILNDEIFTCDDC